MRLFLIGTTLLALAACSPTNETPDNTAPDNSNAAIDNAAAAANQSGAVNYVSEIENMSETGKQGVFLGAIRDANISCSDVTKVERLPDEQGVPTWRAQCDQGEQHLIQVQPDGSARVTSRTNP